MLIYNLTIKLSWSIHDDWLQWMKNEHIPEMLSTKLFSSYQMVRLLEVEEEDGPTYAIQYYTRNDEDYRKYINEFSEGMRSKGQEKWGDQFIAFRSLMEVIN